MDKQMVFKQGILVLACLALCLQPSRSPSSLTFYLVQCSCSIFATVLGSLFIHLFVRQYFLFPLLLFLFTFYNFYLIQIAFIRYIVIFVSFPLISPIYSLPPNPQKSTLLFLSLIRKQTGNNNNKKKTIQANQNSKKQMKNLKNQPKNSYGKHIQIQRHTSKQKTHKNTELESITYQQNINKVKIFRKKHYNSKIFHKYQ